MTPIVRLEHVVRTFGRTRAVVDVSFDVAEGEVVALLGHNGAGKTTLIRLINGLLEPDAGTIATFGLPPTTNGEVVRRRTGVLTTYPGLDDYLTPSENLLVYAAINGLPTSLARERTASLLSRLGLDPHGREPARGLSAGLKQRVALARALIHEPDLLLLDEPTANLDPIAATDVRAMVRELAAAGRTVVFSSHNLAEAEALADRVVILRDGHVLAVGAPAELAAGQLSHSVEVRVGPGQADDAVAAMHRSLNGHPTSIDGDVVRIAGAGADDVPQLVRDLVGKGVDVRAARPATPSLEDVYRVVHQRATP